MRKILFLSFFIGLVGCDNKTEADKRYNVINKKLDNIKVEIESIERECNSFSEKMQQQHKLGNIDEAKKYALKMKDKCEKATALAQEQINLSLEAVNLIPELSKNS